VQPKATRPARRTSRLSYPLGRTSIRGVSSLPFEVRPIDERLAFGAVVVGLDPTTLEQPAVATALVDLWIDRGVIVFRELPGGLETQIRLSRVFGEPELHPLRVTDFDRPAEISDIIYDPADGDVYDLGGERRGGFLPWHFDLAYVARINHGGVLRPVKLPSRGGETGFIDRIAVYESLPTPLRERIHGLSVRYRFDIDASHMRYGKPPRLSMLRTSSRAAVVMRQIERYPAVVHPLVYEQPQTGRRVLNFSPWFALGVEGVPDDEGDALLHELARHCLDESGAYCHRWSPGDMLLWDNWRMLHSATGVPPDERRHMQRTTIAGDYGRGRLADGAGPAPDRPIQV
jgi:alpha-ketoglutarate-dependent taurine dioxygenase